MLSLSIALGLFGVVCGLCAILLRALLTDRETVVTAFTELTGHLEKRLQLVNALLEKTAQLGISEREVKAFDDAYHTALVKAREAETERNESTLFGLADAEDDLMSALQGWLLAAESKAVTRREPEVAQLVQQLAALDADVVPAEKAYNAAVSAFNSELRGIRAIIAKLFSVDPEYLYLGRRPTTEELESLDVPTGSLVQPQPPA